DGAHLAGPGIADDQRARAGAFDWRTVGLEDFGLHAKHRHARAAGLERMRAGHRSDHVAAGLGLPPSVYDRTAAVADDAMIPLPRFGIDRLADAAEQAQA